MSTKKKGAGKKVKVTATAADGSGKKATITISIMKNSVTKITLKAKTKTVKAGKSVTIKATVKTNGKKANKTLAWSLDKKAVKGKYATISKKGVLKTKKKAKGKTITVTAKATDGNSQSNFLACCNLNGLVVNFYFADFYRSYSGRCLNRYSRCT